MNNEKSGYSRSYTKSFSAIPKIEKPPENEIDDDNDHRWNREGANISNAFSPSDRRKNYTAPQQKRPQLYPRNIKVVAKPKIYEQSNSSINNSAKRYEFKGRQQDDRKFKPTHFEKKENYSKEFTDKKISFTSTKPKPPAPKKVVFQRIESVSLPRALALKQFASRRIAIEFIKNSRVSVNNAISSNFNYRIVENKDEIIVDSMQLGINRKNSFVIMHKPKGLVASDEAFVKNIHSLVAQTNSWYFPVGRLDKATSGLTILTNDPAFKNHDDSPLFAVEKKYHIKLQRTPTIAEIVSIEHDLQILSAENSNAFVEIKQQNTRSCWVNLAIYCGKPTEIRSLFKRFGLETLAFHRHCIGNLSVDNLQPGEWRQMNESEIQPLLSKKTAQASFFYQNFPE